MSQIRLFLENKEVELDNSVDFTLNQYFEDTSKPTDKYIEFSKTVSIPFTINNNRLFGSIYSPDRIITYDNTGDYTNIHFDPYKKISMRLQNGDDVLMVGFAKMLSVDWDGEKGVYNLNLYGELGKVFGELSKVTFDNTNIEEDTQVYFIDGGQYYRETLNRQLIYDSWNSNQNVINLVRTNDSHYEPHNIVGWTPLNIRYDNDTLDQKSFELSDGSTKTFTEVLEQLTNPTFVDATKCNPDTAIGDGLMPREIGEWRSYLQQPFMYFNKLMQLMADKCKLLTGYEFSLDPNWFSYKNPFYKNVVFTLKNFEKDEFVSNTYNFVFDPIRFPVNTTDYHIGAVKSISIQNTNEALPIYDTTNKWFDLKSYTVGFAAKFNMYVEVSKSFTSPSGLDLTDDNALIIYVALDSQKTANPQFNNFIFTTTHCTITNILKAQYPNATFYNLKAFEDNGRAYVSDISVCPNFYATKEEYGNVSFIVTAFFYKTDYPFNKGKSSDTEVGIWSQVRTDEKSVLQANVYENYTRSDGTVTLNTLWNNDIKPFDLIMQYCKMFRIGIFADNVSKQVKFIPYSIYFGQYEVLDWTDKLDKGLDYQIKPITYENKWVKFNYDDNSTKLNEKYNKKFGLQFGEYKIDTHYVFNDETEELFEDIKCPMENTDNVLSWTNLYSNKRIVYSFPAEKYIYSKNDDDKLQDNFGTFYLDAGIVDFDTEDRLYLRSNIITDDSRNMRGSGKFVYNQYGEGIKTTKYHQLSTFINKYMITYTVPSYTFCYQDYKGKVGLYETFWQNYLQERYDVQNKIVTCYLRLKNSDWNNFDFNKFVKIDNQLYFVNKIFDYNPSSNEPTKCELITIQDVNGYIKDGYNPYLAISPETATTTRNSGSVVVNVESTQDVYVTSDTPNIQIDGTNLTSANPVTVINGKHTITTNGVPTPYSKGIITFKSGTYTKTLTLTFTSYLQISSRDGVDYTSGQTLSYQSGETDTWVVRSTSSGTWVDVNSSLQGFKINGEDGNGTFESILDELSIENTSMQAEQGLIRFTNTEGNTFDLYIDLG